MYFTKTFLGMDIYFDIKNGIPFLNATKTAKTFKKDLSNWRRSSETIDYMDSLSRFVNLTERDLIITQVGGNDKNAQGTWLHPKLVIFFARWLSPDFAVWCDIQIEELLKNSSTQKQTPIFDTSSFSSEKFLQLSRRLF